MVVAAVPDELLPQDHPARFVGEIVDALTRKDWSELGVDMDGDSKGAPATTPCLVERMGIRDHGRCALVPETGDSLPGPNPYLWLAGWQRPDHNTFRNATVVST